tara:strand:+ start:140 stop:394 length:255 start_codon:yes stop_codon:yes gene_type:complete
VSRRSPIPDTPIEEKPCQIELWDFVDALAKARPVEIDATEGLKSKAVSEAIYESGKSGQVVKVADFVSGKVNAYQRDVDRYWKL